MYAGISSYSPEQSQEASRILKQLGTPCLIHQPVYSMFNRWIEDSLLDVLEEEGIGCIAFCPLAQGLLTNKYLGGIPEGSRAASQYGALSKDSITPELVAKIKKLNDLAVGRGQSLAQMALAWTVRDPRVTSALIGASNPKQIEENVKMIQNLDFDAETLTKIDAILAG